MTGQRFAPCINIDVYPFAHAVEGHINIRVARLPIPPPVIMIDIPT